MGFKTKMVVLGILGMCALSAVAASSDSSACKSKDMGNKIAEELGLNADQKTKLKDLHMEMQTVRKEHMEKMKSLRDKTKEELLKSEPSKTVLYDYAKQNGDLRREMAEKEADHLLKVKVILTEEQFKKLLSKMPPPEGMPPKDKGWGRHRERSEE